MKKLLVIIAVFLLLTDLSALSQIRGGNRVGGSRSGVPQKERIIGEFLREHLNVLPGEQLYKAQDLWESIGAKKIKISEPSKSSKDLVKSITIEDADIVEDFIKVVYSSRNETINSMTLSVELEKGDFFIDKFIEHEGQYEPNSNKSTNIEFSGSYRFDDFTIRVTEFKKDERIDITITHNPGFNRVRR